MNRLCTAQNFQSNGIYLPYYIWNSFTYNKADWYSNGDKKKFFFSTFGPELSWFLLLVPYNMDPRDSLTTTSLFFKHSFWCSIKLRLSMFVWCWRPIWNVIVRKHPIPVKIRATSCKERIIREFIMVLMYLSISGVHCPDQW